jgi:hypothetical protein
MTRLIVSAALVGAAVVVLPCEPNIARCDPASPLYDRVLCYYSGGRGGPRLRSLRAGLRPELLRIATGW